MNTISPRNSKWLTAEDYLNLCSTKSALKESEGCEQKSSNYMKIASRKTTKWRSRPKGRRKRCEKMSWEQEIGRDAMRNSRCSRQLWITIKKFIRSMGSFCSAISIFYSWRSKSKVKSRCLEKLRFWANRLLKYSLFISQGVIDTSHAFTVIILQN
jgi:hypothetical protein